jgi:hypothetical protein
MTNFLSKISKAFTALLVVFIALSVGIVGQSKKAQFDPDGSFWINGNAPDGFLDFGGINLNAKRARRLPSPGVQLNNGKTFRFKLLSVKQERFTFTTVAVSNISYSFSGKFLRGGVFASATLDDQTPVLEGVLTKFKGGQKVAEANLKFVYFGGT